MRYREGGDDAGTEAKTRLGLGISKKQGGDLGAAVLRSVTSDGNVYCSHLAEWLVSMIHAELNYAFLHAAL